MIIRNKRSNQKRPQCMPMLTLAALCFSLLTACGHAASEKDDLQASSEKTEVSEIDHSESDLDKKEASKVASDGKDQIRAGSDADAGNNQNAVNKAAGSTISDEATDYPTLLKPQILPDGQPGFMPLPMGEPMHTSDGHTLSWSFTEGYTADGIILAG